MRSSSRGVITLAAAFLVLAGSTSAGAQTQRDVDEAARAVKRAEARLNAARAGLGEADEFRDLVGTDLAATIDAYTTATNDLQDLTFRVARLREEVISYEADVRRLREEARSKAVAAYMSGGTRSVDALFEADSLREASVGRMLLDRAAARDITLLERFTAARLQTEELRSRYEAQVESARIKQGEADLLVAEMELLFDDADAEVAEAESVVAEAATGVSRAEADYRAAVVRFEEEIRRRAEALGVEKWRTLVERYFPPARVAEAFAVMRCESGGNPRATNASSGAAGLYQFLLGTWSFASARAGFGGASRYDPEANIAAAAWLVQQSIDTGHPRGAWGHWSCRTVLG